MGQAIEPETMVGQRREGRFVSSTIRNQRSIYHLVSAWTYGRVEIQFKLLSNEPPFEDVDRRLEMLRLLNQIPGVSLERDAIDRRPSISLETLATAGAAAKLCTALEWVVEQATRAA